MMRKVTAGLFISLDGVTEAPHEWQFDVFDDDMMAAMNDHINAVDTILLGRVTYQDWAAYWPTSSDEPYASHINTTPKYVVSTTLDTVEWGTYQTIHLIKDNLADALGGLKQQPGKNIGTAGSPTLVRRLLQANLLDELTLMIHPVVVGKGKRLFEGEGALQRMQLVESTITKSGVSILTYQPA
jgi:dihydrofolate reductase